VLVDQHGPTSFQRLRALVDKSKATIRPKNVCILAATPDAGFVASLLAFLEEGVPVALVSRSFGGRACRAKKAGQPSPHGECALILFTSGSSGHAKAVQLSRANIEANLEAVLESLNLGAAGCQTLYLPLSYSFGLLASFFQPCGSGFHEARDFRGSPVRLRKRNGSRHVERSSLPLGNVTAGDFTRKLPRGNARDLRRGALSLDLRRRLARHFANATIYNNYGLTEAAPRVLSLPSTHPHFFAEDTLGLPVRHVSLREGAEGELLVCGKQVMLGYLGERSGEGVGDGWLHTGDRVTIGADSLVRFRAGWMSFSI